MNIQKKIRGAFALVFLFGDGIKAFTGEKRAALLSFLIPLGLLPFGMWSATVIRPMGMEKGFSDADVMAAQAAQTLISTALSLILVFAIAWGSRQQREAWLFLETINWASLVMTALSVPLLLAGAKHWIDRVQVDHIAILTLVYGTIVTGCIANRSFRLNWQLAGAIACFMMVADQESWSVVYKLWHVPYPRDL
jgi:hypothetical protein